MLNPYENTVWDTVEQIKSMSHMHATNQERFNKSVEEGYRHFAITNYQPSVPTYPLDKFFTDVPDNVIGSPNTEKVFTSSYGGGLHVCSIGSFAERHGHTYRDYVPWQTLFDEVFSQLQYPDAGGITVNHPSTLTPEQYMEILDYDDRVLGIEIYNNASNKRQGKFWTDLWDQLLSTGRRCYGFAVVDWRQEGCYGSNILLVPEFTEHECLKAYRNGRFYAQLKDVGLRFSTLDFDGKSLAVSVNKECTVSFITARGRVGETVGKEARYEVSEGDVFVRVEAVETADSESHIFSNPIML